LGDFAATVEDFDQSVGIVLARKQIDGFEQCGLAAVIYARKKIDSR